MLILIVDDDQNICNGLNALLCAAHEVALCHNGREALEHLKKRSFDIVITDHQMPGVEGLELIRQGKALSPTTAFLLMTAYGSHEQSIEAIRLGADDYLIKPFDFSELEYRVQRIQERRSWRTEQNLRKEDKYGIDRLVGTSKCVAEIKRFVLQVTGVDTPVLLLGPTGAGKEVVALAIHESGPCSRGPFVPINCASLSEQLMESELFGHEKGAFTGAIAAKPGKFELAKGGTLFLDELGELSPALQAKLLRVIQEKEFYRVGGVRQIRTDARVIGATHRPLKEMVASGAFREDLYFRLNVLNLELPRLRGRLEDISLLTDHFLRKLQKKIGKTIRLEEETQAMLLRYPYPGNVRELQNVLERLVVLCPQNGIAPAWMLPSEFHLAYPETLDSPSITIASDSAAMGADSKQTRDVEVAAIASGPTFNETVAAFEAGLIAAALNESNQNQALAAKILSMDRSVLRYKMKKYGLLPASSSIDDSEKAA